MALIRLAVGLGFLGLIGTFFIGGFGMLLAIPLAAADVDRLNHERYVRPAQEIVFRDLCPDYRDASTWQRWTNGHYRNLSWCAEYIDRL